MSKLTFSRRDFLGLAFKTALALPASTSLLQIGSRAMGFGWDPWPYEPLNPDQVADRAYQAYAGFDTMKGCSYASFDAIVNQLKESVGYPFTEIPTEMCTYGKSGIVGWGHLCGSINGACAAINLVVGPWTDIEAVIDDLVAWYTQEALPTYVPPEPRLDVEIPATIAKSALCHASVSRWCRASGFTAHSAERKERCARLTADVAKKAVILLNSLYDGSFSPQYQPAPVVDKCMRCHGKDALDDTKGKMDCLECHQGHRLGYRYMRKRRGRAD